MSSYSSIADHRSMVFDEVRNAAYAAALGALVTPDSVVLDLGSGLGLHGLVAAARGARHVYLVDPSPVTAKARQVAVENGLGDRITCIQKTIEEADLPVKVDAIVSVFTGNFLLEEDLLPSLFFARDKYLKPGGVLVPDCGEMRVAPVSAAAYYQKYVGQWSEASQGIRFASIRSSAANSLYYHGANDRDAEFLSAPETLLTLDFHTAVKAECDSEVTFRVAQAGECHGFLGWFRMRLGQEWLSTSPLKPALHWSQVFMPLETPLQVDAGDTIAFRLRRPQFGEWTWQCSFGGKQQRQSTFFSRAFSLEQLKTRDKAHKSQLNEKGELARFVMDLLTGEHSNDAIMDLAAQKFGDRFTSRELLEKRVQAVITSYGK